MPAYRNAELHDMPTEELLNHLYGLGAVEHLQASYEIDEFYDEVEKTQEELLNRINSK